MSVEDQGTTSTPNATELEFETSKQGLINLPEDVQKLFADIRASKQKIDEAEGLISKSGKAVSVIESEAVAAQTKIQTLSNQIASDAVEIGDARKQSNELIAQIQSAALIADKASEEMAAKAKQAEEARDLVGNAEALVEGLHASKQRVAEFEAAASKSNIAISEIETGITAEQTKIQTLSDQISKDANEIGDARKQSQETLSKIQSDATISSKVSGDLLEKAKLAEKASADIESHQTTSAAHEATAKASEQQAKEAADAATASVDAVRASEKELNQLKVQLATSLRKLEDSIATFDTRLNTYEQIIDNQSKEVAATVKEANDMLSGATSAALATSFKSEADVLDKKGNKAQLWFTIGIVALLGSLVPLLFLLFGKDSNPITIESILARSILVAPAVWFCSFMARQHGALFELRHHYGHKHNMTFSMNAFRRLADDDKTGITKEVFQNISKNPADVLRKHRKMSEGPFAAMMPNDTEENEQPNPQKT